MTTTNPTTPRGETVTITTRYTATAPTYEVCVDGRLVAVCATRYGANGIVRLALDGYRFPQVAS